MTPSFDAALAFAQDLVRTPSLPGAEGDVARRVLQEMESLGYDEAYTDELGSVVGVLRGGGGPPVMLSCHLDMVAAGDEAEWEFPPFDGVIAGGCLHGRGAMDIKGPLALQTHAAAALKGKTDGDVIVAHTVFEERGGWGMDHLTRLDGGLAPAAVIIGESTNGDVAIGHRGRAEVEIVVRGLAGHASAPERARNALDALPAVLKGVEDLAASQYSAGALGSASVVATDVHASPASRNVVPDQAVVVLDWRILPSDTEECLLARVRSAIGPRLEDWLASRALEPASEGTRPPSDSAPAGSTRGAPAQVDCRLATEVQRSYTGVEAERRILTPGFLVDAAHPVAAAAARAVGRRGSSAPARIRPWKFATDGGWTCGVRGIPTIGFAPGEERHAHTNTERLSLDEARWAYGKYLELVPAVQGAAREPIP